MIKIAVCDDDALALDHLCQRIQELFSSKNAKVLPEKFSSGNALLKACEAAPFDVVFLDIKMPGRDGFEIAREICRLSEKLRIIFVTEETALVYDSFDFRPFGFIPKSPRELFERQLERAADKLLIQISALNIISLPLPYNQTEYVDPADIVCVKSRGNDVEYNFINRCPIKLRRKLDDAAAELSPYLFLRLHKSYVVNMSHIQSINYSEMIVFLKDGSVAYISKSRKKDVEIFYGQYRRSFGR